MPREMASAPTRAVFRRFLTVVVPKALNADGSVLTNVTEPLRSALTRFAGADSFMYIFQRSLVYARRESPALESVTVDADGSVQGLDNLWLSASAIDRSAAIGAEVTVVVHLYARC